MTRGRSLTAGDIEVWRAVAESVSWRMPGATLPARPAEPKRGAVGSAAETRAPTAPDWSPPPPRRTASEPNDVERALRKKVKSGRQPIEASLDLHGFRQAEAHVQLTRFVVDAQRAGFRLVVVVTGKGSSVEKAADTGSRGVLRRLVPLWLAEPRLAPMIVGFGEAGRTHGGAGALYVHLRQRQRARA